MQELYNIHGSYNSIVYFFPWGNRVVPSHALARVTTSLLSTLATRLSSLLCGGTARDREGEKAFQPRTRPRWNQGSARRFAARSASDGRRRGVLRRDDPPASPELRQRDITIRIVLLDAEALLDVLDVAMQLVLADDGALPARPGADAAAEGAAAEIGLALLPGELLDVAEDADLFVDLAPVEGEGGARVLCELARLARGVVGVEDEAAVVELLEEDDAGGGDARGGRGGEGHGLGLVDLALHGREPGAELVERARGDGGGGEVVGGDVLLVCEDLDLVRGLLEVGLWVHGVHLEGAALGERARWARKERGGESSGESHARRSHHRVPSRVIACPRTLDPIAPISAPPSSFSFLDVEPQRPPVRWTQVECVWPIQQNDSLPLRPALETSECDLHMYALHRSLLWTAS